MKSIFSFYYITVFVLVLLASSNMIHAQGLPGGGPGPCTSPPCDPPNPPGLPIDGGAIFLLSSGLIYAANKLRNKEK